MCSARLLLVAATIAIGCTPSAPESVRYEAQRSLTDLELTDPEMVGTVPLEQVFADRRSTREFSSVALDMTTIGQLLWAGQGVTDDAGHRTSPSAGATYPIELYALTATTFVRYLPAGHRVEQRRDTRSLDLLAAAAFEQEFVNDAPVVLVITGIRSRTEAEYGAVGHDLMNREAGHVAQNILLQATALGLAAVPVGGFDPAEVRRLLALGPGEEVLYLLPVGHPASTDEE